MFRQIGVSHMIPASGPSHACALRVFWAGGRSRFNCGFARRLQQRLVCRPAIMRFEHCAKSYDEHAAPQRHFAERVARFLLAGENEPPLPAGTVLELGAGTGALTRHLAGAGADGGLVATDAAPGMVERGRTRVPGAEWRVLDAFAEALPVAARQVSSGLLHWSPEPAATLARWKQFLLPGGQMTHAMPCEPCLAEWRALVPESPVLWRDAAAWRAVFAEAGLRVTRWEAWTHTVVCPSALALARGMHRAGVTGRVRIGPARLRQALRAYEARHRRSEGVSATWAWVAIAAAPV